jgi:thiol-disulfide isomerase/thioredoxin
VENTSPSPFMRIWRTALPWLVSLALVAVLRYTGVLGEISYLAGSILLKTGIMNASTEAPPVIHDFTYDFALQDLDGNVVKAEGLRGKTLFINVWATWCGPCRIEMPSLQALYAQADTSRVVFLMISVDEYDDREKVKKFIADKRFTFPVYLPVSELPDILEVRSIPSTFVVAPNGKVIMRKSGLANYNTSKVKELLQSL